MLENEKLKRAQANRFEGRPGLDASISHHPYRKLSPKRQVKVHTGGRVKKGPMESRG